jgi:hypothetical protein
MSEVYERAKRFLFGRMGAYHRTFVKESVDADIVLADLARFCRAHESTGALDSHVAARLDGRREVWLRIQHHLNLSTEELWSIYGNKNITKE